MVRGVGVCGWNNHHVYPWKKSKYKGILWYIFPSVLLFVLALRMFAFYFLFAHENLEFLLWSAVIYPSLLQLEKGVTDSEDKRQKAVCMERYRRRDDDCWQSSDIDIERDDECGICMEMNSKIVLPNCNHAMCLKCYREWYSLPLLFLYLCACVCVRERFPTLSQSWLVDVKKQNGSRLLICLYYVLDCLY